MIEQWWNPTRGDVEWGCRMAILATFTSVADGEVISFQWTSDEARELWMSTLHASDLPVTPIAALQDGVSGSAYVPPHFPPTEALTDRDVIALLEAAIREKDEINAAQYQEIIGLRRRLDQAVSILNEITGVPEPGAPPTSSNLGHG